MASGCGGTLSLMDAGVPITHPVAGISIGLVKDGERFTLLTDIMGDEDHFGDMDFKVAGTGRGITGIQLDLKIDGIDEPIIKATLEQARDARRDILRSMLSTLRQPRPEIARTAPRLLKIQINPEKIGRLIGPGDKIKVKVIAIDEHDRVKLSRKAVLRDENPPPEGSAPPPPQQAPPPRREGGDGGGRPPRRDGGGRGRRPDDR